MLKRGARMVGLTLGFIVAVALVWRVVRFELPIFGSSPGYLSEAPYGTFEKEYVDISTKVVREVVLVEGRGSTDQFVTLAAGT